MEKLITCCFTGHRPQKVPWLNNKKDKRYATLKQNLKLHIISAIENGYKIFICGMAIGFDMLCAEMVLKIKKTYPEIELICALPCKNQTKLWLKKDIKRYLKIIKYADFVRCKFEKYNNFCMQERNKFMINNSSLCIALYDGTSGGTKNTITYAKQKGLNIILINPWFFYFIVLIYCYQKRKVCFLILIIITIITLTTFNMRAVCCCKKYKPQACISCGFSF